MPNKTSSELVSIKSYHVPYLRQVGEQIGTDDLSEVVNHVLAQYCSVKERKGVVFALQSREHKAD
jgi:uncharacterized protein YwlG (UPF0340 family)